MDSMSLELVNLSRAVCDHSFEYMYSFVRCQFSPFFTNFRCNSSQHPDDVLAVSPSQGRCPSFSTNSSGSGVENGPGQTQRLRFWSSAKILKFVIIRVTREPLNLMLRKCSIRIWNRRGVGKWRNFLEAAASHRRDQKEIANMQSRWKIRKKMMERNNLHIWLLDVYIWACFISESSENMLQVV